MRNTEAAAILVTIFSFSFAVVLTFVAVAAGVHVGTLGMRRRIEDLTDEMTRLADAAEVAVGRDDGPAGGPPGPG